MTKYYILKIIIRLFEIIVKVFDHISFISCFSLIFIFKRYFIKILYYIYYAFILKLTSLMLYNHMKNKNIYFN